MDDAIKTYVMNVEANVRTKCPTCDAFRTVWVGETVGGDTLTVCGTCQRVIRRVKTDMIPKLNVR